MNTNRIKFAALISTAALLVGTGSAMAESKATREAEADRTAATTTEASADTAADTASDSDLRLSDSEARSPITVTSTLGTKHGMEGTVTLDRLLNGQGKLVISGTGVRDGDTVDVGIYQGTATPVTAERLMDSWTVDSVRGTDGSMVIYLTEAQAKAWHDARLDRGLIVRVKDPDTTVTEETGTGTEHTATTFADAMFKAL
jgi:hypothetical protein